jgi:hypothetical protein
MWRGSYSRRICDLDETEVAQWFARDLLPDHVTSRRVAVTEACCAEMVSSGAVTAAVARRENREA